MADVSKASADFEVFPHHADENGQLPTPRLTPLIGSPVLQSYVRMDESIYESLEGQLSSPNDVANGDTAQYGATTFTSYPISKAGNPRSLHTARKETRQRSASDWLGSPTLPGPERSERVLKLSPKELKELTFDAASLPVRRASPNPEELEAPFSAPLFPQDTINTGLSEERAKWHRWAQESEHRGRPTANKTRRHGSFITNTTTNNTRDTKKGDDGMASTAQQRPTLPTRTVSTPPNIRRKHSSRAQLSAKDVSISKHKEGVLPAPLASHEIKKEEIHSRILGHHRVSDSGPSPIPNPLLPLPPLSLPTFLQLELDSEGPSQLYIQRSLSADLPYESTTVKFERLENFLLLPKHLEGTLLFGAAACFDAWLYNLTILPIRFLRALGILSQWALRNAWKEMCDLFEFVYLGMGRLWNRKRPGRVSTKSGAPSQSRASSQRPSHISEGASLSQPQKETEPQNQDFSHSRLEQSKRPQRSSFRRHRRTRSTPSLLMPSHKADILKGFLIICSSVLLMYLDPSRMYHNIRGQAAIKLYVIYNMLEVADKLLGSIGQDILECLFSRETLERKPDGRSKILRPFSLFLLSLMYNVIHASALFYQVITLNVAVNSYSNALLTLLMSNQFVEIKGAVFKKFEKENLFQMCCADVVERFQLLLMLLIIAMRNIVEVGGLSISLTTFSTASASSQPASNETGTPFSSSAILPRSFDILPSFPSKVLTPFLIVVCSEMVVDWLKYAYINKFNNYKPNIFGRFYDVLAKDYYTNAFGDQNLTRRIGLPVFPLTCLFIRASMQTYHMLIATYLPPPIPSPITGLAVEDELPTSTPSTTAALAHIDKVFRRALGRSGFAGTSSTLSHFTVDDLTATATTLILVLILYLLLLAFKLLWGMFLLSLSRRRYMSMELRQSEAVDSEGKRIGGWGTVELGDERRKAIYEGDEKGLQNVRDKEQRHQDGKAKVVDYGKVRRYDMVAKRIW